MASPLFQTRSGCAARTCAAIEPQSDTVGGYLRSSTTLKPAFFASSTAPPSLELGAPYEMKFVDPPVFVTNAIRCGGRRCVLSAVNTVRGTVRFGLPPVDHVGNWQR